MITIGMAYYPEHWPREIWEEDAQRMETLGVQVVRFAEFSWSRLEPREGRFDFAWLDEAIEIFSRHGMKIILGTPTNCAPLWLYKSRPETLQWGRDGKPTDPGIRGHRCIVSPVFREYAGRIVREMAGRYAGRPEIFAWQIDNELESNHCTCPACRAAFRDWLKKKYGTVEALNSAWGNAVWSGEYSDWSEIDPLLSPDCMTDWHNPAFMLDFERFGASRTTDYVNFQRDIIRKADPAAIVTTNACFPAHMPDFHREFQGLDVAAYDNYPPIRPPEDPEALYSNGFALDFVRGFKRKNFWTLEELAGPGGCWVPFGPTTEPGQLTGYALQTVAHGADLMCVYRWRSALSGAEMMGHGLLDHDNRENRRCAEFRALFKRLERLPGLDKTTVQSDVAILYSADQEFALKNQRQAVDFAYWTQPRLFQEACAGLGVNTDVIHETESLEGYKVVIVPTHHIVEPSMAQKLEDFAAQGGTVVLTNRSGVKDKTGNCLFGQPLPGPFRTLCGCFVEEYDPIGKARQRISASKGESYAVTGWCDLIKPETAEVWARYEGRFYAGTAAVTKNAFGSGRAYYVGTVGEKALYRALMTEILREQAVPMLTTLPRCVEVTTRSGAGGVYRFFFNNQPVGCHFPLEGETVSLRPFEMAIRTGEGKWV